MSIGGNAYGNSGVQAPVADSGGYCTQQDVVNRIGMSNLSQLTNDVTNASTPNVAVLDSLIEDAGALIDSKLGSVYTVPFTAVPTIIKSLAVDITVYMAFQRRPVNLEMPKTWQKVYDDAMQMLEDISSMLIVLPATATVANDEAAMNVDRSNEVDFNDSTSDLNTF